MININNKKFLIIFSIIAIIIGIFLIFYIYNKDIVGHPVGTDGKYQFYQMEKHINEKKNFL